MRISFRLFEKFYKYCLDEDFSWESGIAPELGAWQESEVRFLDEAGQHWLSIGISGRITVYKGYAWDGCSPAIKAFGKVWGTPDGAINPRTGKPYTYHASLLHDALYQFLDDHKMPYTREQIDRIFYRRMIRDSFPHAALYYNAVKYLGGAYRQINRFLQ